jgi:hypothetical protein
MKGSQNVQNAVGFISIQQTMCVLFAIYHLNLGVYLHGKTLCFFTPLSHHNLKPSLQLQENLWGQNLTVLSVRSATNTHFMPRLNSFYMTMVADTIHAPNQSFNPDATSSAYFHHRNAPHR